MPENASEEEQKSIQTELDKLLLPAWAAVADMPAVTLDQKQSDLILHGQSVEQAEYVEGDMVRLFAAGEIERFLGVAEVVDNRFKPKRLICTEADQ